jgi:MATE family multidrug resistance protein
MVHEARQLLKVAVPMMAAQGGMVVMGVVDTAVAGRVSATEVAAIGLGNNTANLVMAAGIGLAMGVEPFVAQAMGRGDSARALHWLQQSVWLGLMVALPLSLTSLAWPLGFQSWGIEPAVSSGATWYIVARLPGHWLCFLFSSYRSFLSATGRTADVLWAVAWANIANLVLDLGFVHGLGWGAAGVGGSTSLCWGLLFFLGQRAVRRRHGVAFAWSAILRGDHRPRRPDQEQLLGVGTPVAMQFVCEVGIFTVVALLVATLGEVPMAGHQIAITMASLTFMGATGIAIAATARVGHHIGAGSATGARTVGVMAIGLGGAFMTLGGAVFLAAGGPIARFFAPSAPEVVDAATTLLAMAAFFSLSDGVQAVAAGALRGAGDTRYAFGANMVGYWGLGLPISLWLGFGVGWGAIGFWWGLVVGLTVVAFALSARFWMLASRPLTALEAS